MKTQRRLPPPHQKKKIIFLQNQGKTQRWRGKQIHNELKIVLTTVDFLGGLAVKNLPANEGDMCSIPGLGRFPGERIGYPLQCSSLENPMDRGAWRASDHGIVKVRQDLETEQLDHCTKKSQCRKLGDTYGSPDHTPGTSSHLRSSACCSYLEVLSSKPIFLLSHRPTLSSQFWQPVLKSPCFQSVLHTTGLLKINPTPIHPPLGPLGGTHHPFPLSISLYNFWPLANTQLSSGLSVSSPVPPCSLCLLQLRFYPFRPHHLGRCSEGRGRFVILSPPPFTPS